MRCALVCAVSLFLSHCAHRPELRADDSLWSNWPARTVGPVPLAPWPPRHECVLVTFITTWCFPCLAELAVLQKLHELHAKQGLRIVVVGMDREGAKVLGPFRDEYGLPFPVVVADAALLEGRSRWGNVGPLPTRVLFAREGEIVEVVSGPVSPDAWLKRVKEVVDQ